MCRKLWLPLVVVVSILLITAVSAAPVAAPAVPGAPVRIIVNGKDVYTDVAPIIINGRTMVPVRVVAEALGAEVNWDEAKRAVVISREAGLSGALQATAQSLWSRAREIAQSAARTIAELIGK